MLYQMAKEAIEFFVSSVNHEGSMLDTKRKKLVNYIELWSLLLLRAEGLSWELLQEQL